MKGDKKLIEALQPIISNLTDNYPIQFLFAENSKKYDSGVIMQQYNDKYNGNLLFTPYHKPISKCYEHRDISE